MRLLLEIRRERAMTLVVATHDSRLAERADRVVNLVDGLIVDGLSVDGASVGSQPGHPRG